MKRVRSCGNRGVLPGGATRVRASGHGDDRRAGFAGLASCGSVWACPVCSERILAGRQDELARAITEHRARGGRLALVTLTMRHRRGQRLADLWDGLSYAWGKVTSGRQWERLSASYGLDAKIGYARVVETTHGKNGWHVHAHVALFLPGSTTGDQVSELGGSMFATWAKSLARRGFTATAAGFDAKLWAEGSTDLGDYFAKNTYDGDASAAALELARGDLKQARAGNRTPFRILGDIVELGLADDVELWEEWERASKGRRQLTWSAGLRADLLAGDLERTDEDLAAEELGSADDDLVEIPSEGLAVIARHQLHALVLDVAEMDDDGRRLRAFLDQHGIAWREVQRNRVGA